MADHLNNNYENNGGPTEKERTQEAIDHALQQIKASNKRKRDPTDHGGDPQHGAAKRTVSTSLNGNGHDANDMARTLYADPTHAAQDFSALSQQLARHVANTGHNLPDHPTASSTAAAALAGIMPQLTVPQPTELSFASSVSATDVDRQLESSFDLGGPENGPNHTVQGSPYNLGGFPGGAGAQLQAARESSTGGGSKPAVGSDEWHKVRRDNHKEGKMSILPRDEPHHRVEDCVNPRTMMIMADDAIVERRRRETINEGINELAKIVPGCEKNKGSILQRAVQYITQLRENETKNIEKWTLEKLLTDQAITELSMSVDKLKSELERAWAEAKRWETQSRSRNLDKEDDDAGGTDDDDGDT